MPVLLLISGALFTTAWGFEKVIEIYELQSSIYDSFTSLKWLT